MSADSHRAPVNPRPPRPAAIAAIACALVGLTLAVGASFAQVPGLPSLTAGEKAGAQGTKPAATESVEQISQRIREQLAELRKEPAPAPEGITKAEVEAAAQTRAALRYVLERQLRAYEELASARELRLIAEERERGWTGFEQAAPYPIQMVDDLRDAAGIVRSRIATLEAGGIHLDAELSRYQDTARRAEAAQRAANEALAGAKNAAAKAAAVWRRDAAATEARRAVGWPVLSRLLRALHDEEVGTRRAELRLLERQIAVAAGSVRFTEEDVAEARQRAAENVTRLGKALAAATSAADARQREREAASRELARLKEAGQAGPEAIAVAEARLNAADAWLNARRSEMEALRGEITLAEELTRLWAQRLAATKAADADARRQAADGLAQAATLFGPWLSYVQNQLNDSRMALRDAEAQLNRATDTQAATIEFDRQAVAAASHTLATTERVQSELARLAAVLNRWVAELKAGSSQRSFATRALDAWSATRQVVRDVWNFELFAVEDSVVLDGRTVTTSHGVTVGKSVGALVLFVGGYALAALLTRRLARWLVGRGADERIVRTLRRWFLAVNALVLLLFTLNIAKIPLTVFAFLGGTLAIAVGFGAQTFVKNLISGMILLVERSVQIGDIVEVEGVSGTVTAVDLRSSTVRGFDGTETIVPNSQLLENKFTNWTHTDRRLRRIVKVGVAYGSPVRQVADILEECAKRHGLVLDEPSPRAIFEDFGDNALIFALHVWIDFKPEVSALVVLSDLRFMIERQFRDAGIVMAFPQRDVHLDSAGPLRVELVRAADAATPPG